MPDREKVIKGLECCIKRDPDDHTRCGECPYQSTMCGNRLKIEALALLKEQEPVVPHRNYQYLSDYWCECGWHLGRRGSVKYCPECGRAVKWDG